MRPVARNRYWAHTSSYVLIGILAAASCFLFGFVTRGYIHPHTSVTESSEAQAPAHPHEHTNSLPVTITHASSTPPSQLPSTSELRCGNSSMEAREIGCVFDLLTNSWMPKVCSDPATDDEYRAWVLDPSRVLGSFAFYHDEGAERQVESESALSDLVGSHIYTTAENHVAHCIFLARRMHRLIKGDIAAVAHNTFSHTMHCTSAILEALGSAEQPLRAQIGSTFDVSIVTCVVEDLKNKQHT
jgi:hypothetical protein